jgi:hypothetical protein
MTAGRHRLTIALPQEIDFGQGGIRPNTNGPMKLPQAILR